MIENKKGFSFFSTVNANVCTFSFRCGSFSGMLIDFISFCAAWISRNIHSWTGTEIQYPRLLSHARLDLTMSIHGENRRHLLPLHTLIRGFSSRTHKKRTARLAVIPGLSTSPQNVTEPDKAADNLSTRTWKRCWGQCAAPAHTKSSVRSIFHIVTGK